MNAQPWSVRIADIRPAGDDWSVTFRDGHETGRDRKDRFLTTDTTGRWIERPEQPAGEGVDESGSDRAFWTDVLGTDPLSDK